MLCVSDHPDDSDESVGLKDATPCVSMQLHLSHICVSVCVQCVWHSCTCFFSSEAQRRVDHRDPLSGGNHSRGGGGGLLGVISWSDRSMLWG